ncbi:MAG TPA: hypothetical protein PKA13_03885 [Geminicoccaceae bacterium]|nr:hypothetical protein [Geminicoccus sp.]HMU48889.1 hypothetical protein [Geminicoccaceae bacterium]
MNLSYDHLQLRYEPFPIGLAKPVLEPADYDALVAEYPPLELFQYMPKVGKKYSLSEKNNPDKYKAWLADHPKWKAFHDRVKSREFITGVLAALKERGVDLGLKPNVGVGKRLRKLAKNLTRGELSAGDPGLTARFEFSMLPADGGSVIPHTDSPGKVITLVVSMMKEGEWDPAFGGGTDVNRPKDPRLYYNELNRQAGFDEMETLETFPFEPNQAVIFVKTFNSWHSVRPMRGDGSQAMRKTLTINIETTH